jgi:hypothetical protein
MDNDAKEKLKLARQDVRPVFDDLTDNPEELCNVMRKSKVILSGSRAVNLFKPGSSSKASDYDFYAEDNVHSIAMFMAYMTSIGVNWLISNNIDEDVTTLQDEHYYYQLARFQLIRGTLNRNGRVLDVQLMWRHGFSASQCVMKFHSTAPQCFISGFVAVSLYHNLTRNDKSLAWYLNDIYFDSKDYTQADSTVDIPLGFQDDVKAKPINKYMDVSSWRTTFDEYIDRLNYLSWIELEGRTEVVSNPLTKYICLETLPERFEPERSPESGANTASICAHLPASTTNSHSIRVNI